MLLLSLMSSIWKKYFIHLLSHTNFQLYLKGGAVLGLYLQNRNLIKDWDFVAYGPVTDDFYHISKIYDIQQDGKSIIVMRSSQEDSETHSHKSEELPSKPLIELAVKPEPESFSSLEFPMTAMKIKITLDIIDNLFDVIDGKQISKFDVLIYESDEHGLFNVNNFDDGNLSNEILSIIKTIPNESSKWNESQLLVSLIKEPDRFFLRLQKNINKSSYIKWLGVNETWLLDENHIYVIINEFTIKLKKMIDSFSNEKIIILHTELLTYLSRKQVLTYQIENVDLASHIPKKFKNITNPIVLQNKLEDLRNHQKKSCHIIDNAISCNKKISEYKKILKELHNDILLKLSLLFKNVNIGRLVNIIDKINGIQMEQLKFIFSDLLNRIYLEYIIMETPIALLLKKMKKNNIRRFH